LKQIGPPEPATEDIYLARSREHAAADNLQERRLAGTVGADDGPVFARPEQPVDAPQDFPAVPLEGYRPGVNYRVQSHLPTVFQHAAIQQGKIRCPNKGKAG
jgi:hypothetical protein